MAPSRGSKVSQFDINGPITVRRYSLTPIVDALTHRHYRSEVEPHGAIIAGAGSHERRFEAPLSSLARSTVIKGWIEDKDSIPPSVIKDNALYFPDCDPEVVSATVEYLKSADNGLIAILDQSVVRNTDVLFYVRLYKFAVCLG